MSNPPKIPARVQEFLERNIDVQNELSALEREVIDLEISFFGIKNRRKISELNDTYRKLAKQASILNKSQVSPDSIEQLEGVSEFSKKDFAEFMQFKQGGALDPHYDRLLNLSESIDRRLVAKKSEMNTRASILISLMAVFISLIGFFSSRLII